MKISTKGKYGLEAVLFLAVHNNNIEPMKLKIISDNLGLSDKYLEQLFISLRKNGIVKSIRGAQGGYRLSKPLQDITITQVLNALEGPLSPVTCILANKDDTHCNLYNTCATKDLWYRVMKRLTHVGDSITIKDLVESYHTNYSDSFNSIEYYI